MTGLGALQNLPCEILRLTASLLRMKIALYLLRISNNTSSGSERVDYDELKTDLKVSLWTSNGPVFLGPPIRQTSMSFDDQSWQKIEGLTLKTAM
jgi:hypothetical protein